MTMKPTPSFFWQNPAALDGSMMLSSPLFLSCLSLPVENQGGNRGSVVDFTVKPDPRVSEAFSYGSCVLC